MSFTMEQYNEALLSVIDKNKRYAIEELQNLQPCIKPRDSRISYTP